MDFDDKGLKELEKQIGAAINGAYDSVAADMSGQPVAEIEAEIRRRVKAAGVNYEPGWELVHNAETIAAGQWKPQNGGDA